MDEEKLTKLAEMFDTEANKMGKLIDEINTYCSEWSLTSDRAAAR